MRQVIRDASGHPEWERGRDGVGTECARSSRLARVCAGSFSEAGPVGGAGWEFPPAAAGASGWCHRDRVFQLQDHLAGRGECESLFGHGGSAEVATEPFEFAAGVRLVAMPAARARCRCACVRAWSVGLGLGGGARGAADTAAVARALVPRARQTRIPMGFAPSGPQRGCIPRWPSPPGTCSRPLNRHEILPSSRYAPFFDSGGRNDCEPVARARYAEVAEALEWLSRFTPARPRALARRSAHPVKRSRYCWGVAKG